MFAEGPWWIPPEIPFDNHGEVDEIENSSDEEEREKQREHITKGNLSKVAKRRLEIMLRKIDFQRGTIAKAMVFAINHSDAADEVMKTYLECHNICPLMADTKLRAGHRYNLQVHGV